MKHPQSNKSKLPCSRFFRKLRIVGLSLSTLIFSYATMGLSSDVHAEPTSEGKTVESFSHELIDIEREVLLM